jgi:hypothetical protein
LKRPDFISLFAILLVVAGVARIAATYPVFNQTSDEPYHLACGMEWLSQGKYSYEHQHPPLARVATAIGPYLAGLRSTGQKTMDEEGNQLLYSGGHYFRNLALARMGVLPFFILACALVWSWSKRLFGSTTALASILLFTTMPPILAHSGLATTDMAAAAFLFASVYAFTLWLERPDWKRGVLFGLSVSLAVLSKFSALLFLPACLLATLLVYWLAKRGAKAAQKAAGPPQRTWWPCATHWISSLALAAVLALLVIWGAYRFSFGPMEPDSLSGHRPLETVDRMIDHASVPAPELFNGIAEVEWHNTRGHPSWLLGEYSIHGWWYFFPIVLAVKTPIAFFLLCIVGYDACFSRGFRKYWQAWVPGVCAPVILAASMPSHINLGVRHILAMYPMLAIIAGFGATSLIRRRKAAMALGIALLAWQTVSSALAHPDYLAYFNEIVWSEPERILSDSDLDWGQDLQRLSNKLKELGVKEVSLICFGNVDFTQHGLPVVSIPRPYQPVTGWIAVSAHMMTIESATIQKGLKRADHPLGWLESERPVAKIGKSIKLYYIPERH